MKIDPESLPRQEDLADKLLETVAKVRVLIWKGDSEKNLKQH